MTAEEDKTHFGMWCIMASPLLIGCDLTTIRPMTLELLKNTDSLPSTKTHCTNRLTSHPCLTDAMSSSKTSKPEMGQSGPSPYTILATRQGMSW